MENQNTKIHKVSRKQHSIWDSYSIRVTEIALGGDGRNSTGSHRKGREWKEGSGKQLCGRTGRTPSSGRSQGEKGITNNHIREHSSHDYLI